MLSNLHFPWCHQYCIPLDTLSDLQPVGVVIFNGHSGIVKKRALNASNDAGDEFPWNLELQRSYFAFILCYIFQF